MLHDNRFNIENIPWGKWGSTILINRIVGSRYYINLQVNIRPSNLVLKDELEWTSYEHEILRGEWEVMAFFA